MCVYTKSPLDILRVVVLCGNICGNIRGDVDQADAASTQAISTNHLDGKSSGLSRAVADITNNDCL